MALKLYLDSAATQEITALNPDEAKGAVLAGENFVDQQEIWMKSDDASLTYENIEITKDSTGALPAVTLEYAPDNEGVPGTYVATLTPANGAYSTVYKFWRRVTKTNVTEAFTKTDVNHRVKADEYIA